MFKILDSSLDGYIIVGDHETIYDAFINIEMMVETKLKKILSAMAENGNHEAKDEQIKIMLEQSIRRAFVVITDYGVTLGVDDMKTYWLTHQIQNVVTVGEKNEPNRTI